MAENNFLDNVGKFLNEACCGYYSNSTQSQGASAGLVKALKGMHAVDTPLPGCAGYIQDKSIRGQIATQAEYTLLIKPNRQDFWFLDFLCC